MTVKYKPPFQLYYFQKPLSCLSPIHTVRMVLPLPISFGVSYVGVLWLYLEGVTLGCYKNLLLSSLCVLLR